MENIVEYVKHLRNVQFYLLASCIVLLVISSLMRASFVHEAYKDISNIKEFVEEYYQYNSFGSNLDRQDNLHDLYVIEMLRFHETNNKSLYDNIFPSHLDLKLKSRNEVWNVNLFTKSGSIWVVNEAVSNSDISGYVTQNLDAFKKYWDSLLDSRYIIIPKIKDKAAVFSREVSQFVEAKINSKPEKNVGVIDVNAHSLTAISTEKARWLEQCLPKDKFGQWFHGIKKIIGDDNEYVLCPSITLTGNLDDVDVLLDQILIIPVTVEKIRYWPLENIIKQAGFEDWKARTFERTFRELTEVTSDYDDITLEKLHIILEGEKKRAGEGINIFGVHVSSILAREWGAVVILSIQIYFFLHLQSFPNVRNESIGVPWAALYRTGLAKFVFVFSAILFPPATILALLYTTWQLGADTLLFWQVSIICIMGSVLISVFSHRAWVRLF